MKKASLLMLFILPILGISSSINCYSQDWANFKKYKQENERMAQKENNEFRVVFMGNSITEFWKSTDSSYFNDNHYIDRGISGQTTPQMLIRFRPDVIELNPNVVVILAGINDIAENTGPIPIKDIYGNIISMVELAQSNGIKPILCSVLPVLDFYWHPGLAPIQKIIALNNLLRTYAEKHDIPFVDYYQAMVDENKGLNKMYSDDGVHPNLAGYKIMEPLLEQAIGKLKNLKNPK